MKGLRKGNEIAGLGKILVLGPNPAYQKVMTFDSPLQLGGVNRAASVRLRFQDNVIMSLL